MLVVFNEYKKKRTNLSLKYFIEYSRINMCWKKLVFNTDKTILWWLNTLQVYKWQHCVYNIYKYNYPSKRKIYLSRR